MDWAIWSILALAVSCAVVAYLVGPDIKPLHPHEIEEANQRSAFEEYQRNELFRALRSELRELLERGQGMPEFDYRARLNNAIALTVELEGIDND